MGMILDLITLPITLPIVAYQDWCFKKNSQKLPQEIELCGVLDLPLTAPNLISETIDNYIFETALAYNHYYGIVHSDGILKHRRISISFHNSPAQYAVLQDNLGRLSEDCGLTIQISRSSDEEIKALGRQIRDAAKSHRMIRFSMVLNQYSEADLFWKVRDFRLSDISFEKISKNATIH